MGTILSVLRKVEKVDTDEVSSRSVDQTKDKLIEVINDQSLHGVNNKGGNLGKYRNPVYARKKQGLNPLPGLGNVDKKLTGAYYGGRYAKVSGGVIQYGSTDEKAVELDVKYPDSYGLSDPFKAQYNEFLRPVFIQNMKKATGL
jgi:hypothetical protein